MIFHSSIDSNQINTKHTATPFAENLIELNSRVKSSLPMDSEAELNHNQQQSESDQQIHSSRRELTFLDNKKKEYLDNLDRFRNYKVSDYYFTNMNDFRRKFFKSNERVQICKSAAPNNSNHLFNQIDKFDIADSYKKNYFARSPEITRLMNEQKDIWADIREASIQRDQTNVVMYKNMRGFHFNRGLVSYIEPPLMRNRSPKKDGNYHRYKFLVQYQNLPNRSKTAV